MLPLIAAGFVAILWGSAPYFQKRLSSGFDPRDFLIYSGLCYFFLICLMTYTRIDILSNKRAIRLEQGLAIFAFTLCFIFIPNIVFLWALQKGQNVLSVTSITYLSPIFTLLVGYLVFGDRICFRKITGVCLLITGALMLN